MFNLATATKLSDCRTASIRALEDRQIVVPGQFGYSYEQLVLIRVIVLLRDVLKVGNFNFAELFKKIKITSNDILVCLDHSNLLIFSREDDWNLPVNKEVFRSDIDDVLFDILREEFRRLKDFENHIYTTISVKNVCAYIDVIAKSLGMSSQLENAKNLKYDEMGLLVPATA